MKDIEGVVETRSWLAKNPMKDIEGVVETRSWLAKFKSTWVITLSKIFQSKFQKILAHLHIIGRKSTKFQMNPMKDVGGLRRQDHGWQSLSQHGR